MVIATASEDLQARCATAPRAASRAQRAPPRCGPARARGAATMSRRSTGVPAAGSAAVRRTSSKMRSTRRGRVGGSWRGRAPELCGGAVGGAGDRGQGELEARLKRRVEVAGEAIAAGADAARVRGRGAGARPGRWRRRGPRGGSRRRGRRALSRRSMTQPAMRSGRGEVDDAVEAGAAVVGGGRSGRFRGGPVGHAQLARSSAGGVRAGGERGSGRRVRRRRSSGRRRAGPRPSAIMRLDDVERGVDRIHRRVEEVVDRVAPPLRPPAGARRWPRGSGGGAPCRGCRRRSRRAARRGGPCARAPMIAPAPIVTPALMKAPWPIQTSGPISVIGQLPGKGRLRALIAGSLGRGDQARPSRSPRGNRRCARWSASRSDARAGR